MNLVQTLLNTWRLSLLFLKFALSVSVPSGSVMAVPDDYRFGSVGVSRKSSFCEGSMMMRCAAGADDPDDEDSERERNAIYTEIGQVCTSAAVAKCFHFSFCQEFRRISSRIP